MPPIEWQGGFNNGGVSPLNITLTPSGLAPSSVLFVLVGFATTGQAVTSVAATLPAGASGTFFQIGATSGGGRMLELWMGYSLQNYPTRVTVTWTGGGNAAIQVQAAFVDAALASAPTTATATNTGTSTSANSGTLTPTVGDVLVATAVWPNATASTARTSAGNTFVWNQERAQSSTSAAIAFCNAIVASASQLTWTITSANWIGLIARLTFTAQTPVAAFVYKGRDQNTDDAGTVP